MAADPSADNWEVTALATLAASGHAFTVADATHPTHPLVWVNSAFERLTGYDLAEVRGRNCRFLQGPDTDPDAVSRMRAALSAGEPITETVLNYRKDGTPFWNQLTISPVHSSTGQLTRFVGVQANADARVIAGQERDAARGQARDAEARLQARDAARARALQESLLPVLPKIAGIELAARYLPASDTDAIGGDWYDVLPLPDGSTGIAIGDVMGHDIRAAGAMGQLRSVLRSYAWEGQGPAEVLDRLNQLVCGLGMAQLATCIYARIETPSDTSPALLRWSNAGHPPPLLRTPDGAVEVLSDARGVLIGVVTGNAAIHDRPSAAREVPPGSTLLFYTDGLVEDQTQDIETGIAKLGQVLAAATPDIDLDSLADRITAAAGHSRHQDDQCLLLVQIR